MKVNTSARPQSRITTGICDVYPFVKYLEITPAAEAVCFNFADAHKGSLQIEGKEAAKSLYSFQMKETANGTIQSK